MVMRLPFVQVDQRYIVAQSRVVASRAAISQAEALGLGVVLFTFALESTWTDEAPPDGVFMGEDVEEILEAAIDWRGERGKAVGAFIRADVIERLQGGLRVRGMDRYREAWEKQTRRKSAAYAGASARWNKTLSDSPPIASQSHANRIDDASQSHRNRMPDASQSHAGRNAKTQTQTHKKPNQQQPAREAEDKKPDPTQSQELDPSVTDAFQRFEGERAQHFGGIPVPPPPAFRERYAALLEGHDGDEEWALQTYRNFWTDDWALKRRPPGSLQAFLDENQWPKHVRPRLRAREPCVACQGPSECSGFDDAPYCYPCLGERFRAEEAQAETQTRRDA
jgi:hypothetical protein